MAHGSFRGALGSNAPRFQGWASAVLGGTNSEFVPPLSAGRAVLRLLAEKLTVLENVSASDSPLSGGTNPEFVPQLAAGREAPGRGARQL